MTGSGSIKSQIHRAATQQCCQLQYKRSNTATICVCVEVTRNMAHLSTKHSDMSSVGEHLACCYNYCRTEHWRSLSTRRLSYRVSETETSLPTMLQTMSQHSGSGNIWESCLIMLDHTNSCIHCVQTQQAVQDIHNTNKLDQVYHDHCGTVDGTADANW